MANRNNHYEAAFEAYLREKRVPYVAVDEAKRSLTPEGSVKSLDFIVSPPLGPSWLIDVKGRRFPSGEENKQYWKNWSTQDDLRSLAIWSRHFGKGFTSLFVFAYHLVADRSPLPEEQIFAFRNSQYAFVAIEIEAYMPHAKVISERWDTVAMPCAKFRESAIAMDDLLDYYQASCEEVS